MLRAHLLIDWFFSTIFFLGAVGCGCVCWAAPTGFLLPRYYETCRPHPWRRGTPRDGQKLFRNMACSELVHHAFPPTLSTDDVAFPSSGTLKARSQDFEGRGPRAKVKAVPRTTALPAPQVSARGEGGKRDSCVGSFDPRTTLSHHHLVSQGGRHDAATLRPL